MKRLLLALLIIFFPASLLADIALVNEVYVTGITSPITVSKTVATGSNRLLIVVCAQYFSSGAITNVTFGGVGLTKYSEIVDSALNATIWYQIAPTQTTADVVCTSSGTDGFMSASAMNFTGVHQSVFLDDIDSNNVTGATISLPAMTTVADNDLVVDVIIANTDTITMTAETFRVQRRNEIPIANRSFGVSTIIPKTPAGVVTMEWGLSGNHGWMAAASFKPAAAEAPAGRSKQGVMIRRAP